MFRESAPISFNAEHHLFGTFWSTHVGLPFLYVVDVQCAQGILAQSTCMLCRLDSEHRLTRRIHKRR